MIIHILVDTSQVLTADEYTNVSITNWILYDQQQIYLHLVQDTSNNYQNI